MVYNHQQGSNVNLRAEPQVHSPYRQAGTETENQTHRQSGRQVGRQASNCSGNMDEGADKEQNKA